jgi:aryl-alcohol dehydrogenase-like predicted oxidoreductase
MEVKRRRLGKSELELTPVGLGAWAIGGGGRGMGWGSQDDADSIAAIQHAVKVGINWVDTAPIYGHGHSEEVVGRAIKEIPEKERPMVFTKCGLIWDESNHDAPPSNILRPDSIRKECEASLKRLGVERIDLYQFHWPDTSGVPEEESWGEMRRLIAEGKVRAGGVSNYTVEMLERCERVGHVDSLQPPFSMIRRESAETLIPWCAAHGTGVIVYSPMQNGLLSGRWNAERLKSLDSSDWRSSNEEFQAPRFERNIALADRLRPIADRHRTSISAVAIAWTLAWPGMTGAIVGGRSPKQIDDWVGAMSLELTSQDLDEIVGALRETAAGVGPVKVPVTAGITA